MTLNLIAKSAVAGATLLAGAVVNLQSAHAVLLNFDFSLDNGGIGSIVLNSDVVDTNQDLNTNPPTSLPPEQVPFVSSFPGAVVAAQYTDATGNVFRNSQPTALITFPTTLANGQQVVQYLTYGDQFGAILNFNLANIPDDVDILNDINSAPTVYQQAGLVPNGSRIDQYDQEILDPNATGRFTATAVPAPSSTAGLVVLGAMSVGSLLKRKWKKK
jgi:hypothetical protein